MNLGVQQVIDLHRRQLAGLEEVRGARAMRRLYEQSRLELEDRLAGMVRAGRGDTFGAHQLRQVLVQVTVAVKQVQRQIAGHLREEGPVAAALAPRHLVEEIQRFQSAFRGSTPVVQAREAATFAGLTPHVPPSLLDHYRASSEFYGPRLVRRIRERMALSLIQGEGVDAAVDRVASSHGMFAGERWRAERIVRTELAYTYGVSKQQEMMQLRAEVPRLLKRLVATFDDRTGEDSKELHGQTVPVDQPFVWVVKNSRGVPTGKVVRYMHPPNRPHDRECVIPWQEEWPAYPTSRPGPVEPTTRGLPTARGL